MKMDRSKSNDMLIDWFIAVNSFDNLTYLPYFDGGNIREIDKDSSSEGIWEDLAHNSKLRIVMQFYYHIQRMVGG